MTTLLQTLLIALCGVVDANASSTAETTAVCPTPKRLSCELLLEPAKTVIHDPQPEFSWEYGSDAQAFKQSAYQIVVHSTTATGTGGIVWDSGRVEDGDSLNIEYKGQPFRPNEEYEWQVKTWNDRQVASAWSEPQRFRMADNLSESATSRYPVAAIQQRAVAVDGLDNLGCLVDFGTAGFGYLKLAVSPQGESRKVQIVFGEKISGDRIDRKPGGTIRTYVVDTIIPAKATSIEIRPPQDRRNTTGAAIRLPAQVGVVAPFRYVEIYGLEACPEREDLVQMRIEYPFDENASSFESSDATLNAIWELCKYSIRATTFCGVYVDGDRERIPYEADAYINQLSHYGVDREYALARYSHEYLLENPTWPTEWKQHSVLMAFADYWYTGNRESLERCYETLKSDKVLVAAARTDGLLDTAKGYQDIVDWPEAERDGHEMRPVNTVVNAFHYATLTKMAYLADVLGHAEDKLLFEENARQFKQTFNQILWNSTTGRYVDGEGSAHSSLHANLFPLAFGLVPPARRGSVVEFIKSRGMQCSVYAAQYLLAGLYRAGEDQYALELLTSKNTRSWFNMIRSGSTITLEAWDQQFKPNLDWNHAWGAAPANLIPRYLVGVRPLEPGFKKIIVQPRPGNLESFAAKVPTPRGAVHVRYSRSGQKINLDLDVPGNSTGRIGIPLYHIESPIRIMHNDKEVPAELGATHAWVDDVPPGRHSFQLGPKREEAL
jgi:hypothetical protein